MNVNDDVKHCVRDYSSDEASDFAQLTPTRHARARREPFQMLIPLLCDLICLVFIIKISERRENLAGE